MRGAPSSGSPISPQSVMHLSAAAGEACYFLLFPRAEFCRRRLLFSPAIFRCQFCRPLSSLGSFYCFNTGRATFAAPELRPKRAASSPAGHDPPPLSYVPMEVSVLPDSGGGLLERLPADPLVEIAILSWSEIRGALSPGKQNGQVCSAETLGGTVVPEDAERGQEKDRGPADEPSLIAIMSAIQDLRGSLEPKLDTVTGDINLLRGDRKKVVEKVTNAETDIAWLQSTSKRLEDQVPFLTAEHEKIMVCLEYQEGRDQRNNIRVVGVPEGAEGPSVELFLETLIVDSLSLGVARGVPIGGPCGLQGLQGQQ
ncbi:hypothetical protein NDU88_002814 [Pleurodeles waltl]|uniref:Uncharacterized protein n=1 Tax=Pleurodeles waltl TaxID=8319 RepID=A0AAV7W0D6_PLEWA|nr:hypothetical protein NDU88_002814 [Pleurodeles waltl]